MTRTLAENPLADNFDIMAGNVSFSVPEVAANDDYIVVRECFPVLLYISPLC